MFWIGVYVFVNLTSILWLGALAINTVAGVEMDVAIVMLALFSLAYSLYGGGPSATTFTSPRNAKL